MYKTHVTEHNFCSLKSNEVTFRKECNVLLVIRYFILGVKVPLQLLVSSYCYLKCTVTKTLLATPKSN
jgi:hypothetical protein